MRRKGLVSRGAPRMGVDRARGVFAYLGIVIPWEAMQRYIESLPLSDVLGLVSPKGTPSQDTPLTQIH